MINIVTLLIILIFIIPIISGIMEPFIKDRFRVYFGSIIYNIEFIFALLVSIYLTNGIFFKQNNPLFKYIYNLIPQNFTNALVGKDMFAYIISIPLLLALLTLLFRLISNPLYKFFVIPFADSLYSVLKKMNRTSKKMFCGLWSLPKAVFYVIIFCLLLKFYTYYFPNPMFTKWMNTSTTYQLVCDTTLNPILNSNVAKQVPVIVNDSFKNTLNDSNLPISNKLKDNINNREVQVIEYFNGVTLDEAIESTENIDNKAKSLVSDVDDSKSKAYILYKWISKNITYDYEKASLISENSSGLSSGAKVAFETRKGICFDYSALYIAMCRATGLKVRLITGLGYSGLSWGDHAWNQVYSPEENRWIDLDTTFGSTAGNYFDKNDFEVDHQYPEIQEEW
jgi:hypothetical protein